MMNSMDFGNHKQICKICLGTDPGKHTDTTSPPEPLQFSDDEPLPDSNSSTVPPDGTLENVRIKAVPERAAVASSKSLPEFSVLVGIKAPSLLEDARLSPHRAPVDLIMVLDDSASMNGEKMELVKHTVHFVIDNLGPSDRLSIVSFATCPKRELHLARMTDLGKDAAKRVIDSLQAKGFYTNIVEGLKKGVRVLEERRQRNPVSAILFLSDGHDNCHDQNGPGPSYLELLPASIRPINGTATGDSAVQREQPMFPVHTFGFGSAHNPVAMHAIAEASDGTFSFIESHNVVQEAFASCIGGLLTVVAQDLRLTLRSLSLGVDIKCIPSARYATQSSQVTVRIGDLYADEEKEFLVIVSVPSLNLPKSEGGGPERRRTSLLDITCSYTIASKRIILVEGDTVQIRRPKSVSASAGRTSFEVDRQRNRLRVADAIAKAHQMAESNNLDGGRKLLSKCKSDILVSISWKMGDNFLKGLVNEIDEITKRMENMKMYIEFGRAFMLSGLSSHSRQRASTRGNNVLVAYATQNMAAMVAKSLKIKKEIKEEEEEEKQNISSKRVKK